MKIHRVRPSIFRSGPGRSSLVFLCWGLLVLAPPAQAVEDWAITLYSAVIVETDMIKVPFQMYETNTNYRLVAVGLSRRLGKIVKPIEFGVEGQLAYHITGNDHLEVNTLATFRWLPFPWDKIINTSFAFGPGVSFASEVPYYEGAHFPKTSSVLMYLLWELEIYYPKLSSLRFVGRLHHRSGAYGTFNGVYAGSNYIGLGLKYAF